MIERCLEKADEALRSQYIEELSFSDKLTSNHDHSLTMLFRSDKKFLWKLRRAEGFEISERQREAVIDSGYLESDTRYYRQEDTAEMGADCARGDWQPS